MAEYEERYEEEVHNNSHAHADSSPQPPAADAANDDLTDSKSHVLSLPTPFQFRTQLGFSMHLCSRVSIRVFLFFAILNRNATSRCRFC